MDVRTLLNANKARMDALYAGQDQLERYEKLANSFRAQFGREPVAFVSAPGRTEVVGNHTDHQNGKVLAASVNLDTVAAIAPRDDGKVVLYSEGYDVPFEVDLADDGVHEDEKETTFALIRGVGARLAQLGYRVGGFDASVTSTVFKGSGLSSSAAFEVMLVAALDALYNGWTVDAKENARISQYAENVYFGKPSGLLDQSASAVGGLVTMDFAVSPASVEALRYDFGAKGYALCVVSAGGEHGNLTADYAAIPAEMKQVAAALGEELLQNVTPERLFEALPALKNRVSDRAILRAFHYVDETRRVEQAVDALRRDDLEGFFKVVIASGESSWKLLQNLHVATSDNQEMPLALEMSRRLLEGRGAWRIHGGGFAGTILAFVPFDMLETYRKAMDGVFGEKATTVLAIRPEGVVCIR
ncbi:MAG: galactokinase family protein [Clostridia bacterium]|nr:galactokinase family protein [Clostridia bacterium]